MRRRTLPAVALCLPWCLLGCGSSSAPTAPTLAQHTPAVVAPPNEPVVGLAGTWVGTIESSNFPPRTIRLVVVQSTNCVDGAWSSDDGQWLGAISGVATADAYVGQISFVRSEDRERCEGIADVDGPITATSLRWSGAGFTVRGTCDRALPQGLVISLRRQ